MTIVRTVLALAFGLSLTVAAGPGAAELHRWWREGTWR